MKRNFFSEVEKDLLRVEYTTHRDTLTLDVLADKMGRTKQLICRHARTMGLTDSDVKPKMSLIAPRLSKIQKLIRANSPHPKGFKNKNHTGEVKKSASERSKAMWEDPYSKVNSENWKQKHSDLMFYKHKNKLTPEPYSRSQTGWYPRKDVAIFMRSTWEMNYAHYLDFLILKGEIANWEYEPDTFWFEEIKRGVRSYKPDFKVIAMNGSIQYHEVKGWMDAKSKTKLNRMRIYYPNVVIKVVDAKVYKSIASWASIIPGWGYWLKEKPLIPI